MDDRGPHDSAEPPDRRVALRCGRIGDLAALWSLERSSFDKDRLSQRQWRHHLGNPRARVLVAEDAAGLAAAVLLLYRADSPAARIHSIAVAARARGRGLGRRLLEAAIARARADGRAELRLEVREDNAAAQRLYATAGFERFGQIRGYYADGCDAQRWRLVLVDYRAGEPGPAGLR